MNLDKVTLTALTFYTIQNLVRCYYFQSLLPLKNHNKKNMILFFFLLCGLSALASYVFQVNIQFKSIADIILTIVLLKCFNIGKLSTMVFYYILSINIGLLPELITMWTLGAFFTVDFSALPQFHLVAFVFFPATLFMFVLHVLSVKILKGQRYAFFGKYVIGIMIISITEFMLVLVIEFHFIYSLAPYVFPIFIVLIILSYFLMNYVTSYIYMEYKQKENTIYFIQQYEEQLDDYMKLKDNEEEISYLRHEIMNQLINYQQTQKGE